MSMTVATISTWPDLIESFFVGDQLDRDVVAAMDRTIYPGLVRMDEVTVGAGTEHGGFVRPLFGTITIAPDTFARAHADGFESFWPPPRVVRVDPVYYASPSAPISPMLTYGQLVGYRTGMSIDGVTYSLFMDDTYTETATGALYTGTLNEVFSAAAATLGVALNTVAARATSPPVYYKTTGEVRILDALDAIASFFQHRFYFGLNGSIVTLYLIDMYRDNGSLLSLTESQWEAVEYPAWLPRAKVTADYTQPSVSRVKIELMAVQGGGHGAVIAEGDVKEGAANLATIAYASASNPSYPVANVVDNNTATYWASGDYTVPGVELYLIASPERSIREYALTASSAYTASMPSRWLVYGWHAGILDYRYLGEAESTGWGALESRSYTIPPANWPAEYTTTYTFGEELRVSPTCARTYSQIMAELGHISELVGEGRDRIRLTMPINPDIRIGRRVSIRDYLTCSRTLPKLTGGTVTQEEYRLQAWLRVDRMTYDFINQSMVVEGEGVIS